MKYAVAAVLFLVAIGADKCTVNAPQGLFISPAQAHPVGRVCAYTDVDGYRATDYCHHLRREQPAEIYLGLPGIRLGWGGGHRYRERRGWWGGGGWGGGRREQAPGIQLNFGRQSGGERGDGDHRRRGNRP